MGDQFCPLLIHSDSTEPVQVMKLKEKFEKGTDEEKIDALKKTILYLLSGEQAPQLLVPIIRFVMPSKNHKIKKLLLLYWEVVDKGSRDDTMLLVCNALLRDVNYPNEYVRGSTLRFLCKLKNQQILQPLIESIRNNLEHRHAYPRRNAVLAIYSIAKDFPHLIPDAADLIYDFLQKEGDATCRRNAFIMLFNCARDKAVEYLNQVLDQVQGFGEILQLIVVELIRKVVRTRPQDRPRYIRCTYSLLSSQHPSVQYEAAQAIVALSSAPTAIKAAASTYINLLIKESDNNVKMIVLDRLLELKTKYHKVLQNLVMDVLRALASPDMDIRNKTLSIALDLVNPSNIKEVLSLLKKEIQKTQSETVESGSEYRHMLVKAVHTCAVKFPDVAAETAHDLMDFLGDDNTNAAVDVIEFAREVIQTYPTLRANLVARLLSSLGTIKSGRVFRSALWIVGEYPETMADIEASFRGIQEVTGDPLFLYAVQKSDAVAPGQTANSEQLLSTGADLAAGPRILPDGSYASSSALSYATASAPSQLDATVSNTQGPALKQLLLMGDSFLGSVLACTLTKLSLKYDLQNDVPPAKKHGFRAKVMLYLSSLLILVNTIGGAEVVDRDSYERICTCFRTLIVQHPKANAVYTVESRKAFQSFLSQQQLTRAAMAKKEEQKESVLAQVDDLMKFRQLRPRDFLSGADDQQDEEDLNKVTGAQETEDYSQRLQRIVQLTGWSDPIYAEAYVHVHQYDILLDVTVINQTGDTLQNLALELSTLGDLKLLERPQTYTLGAYAQRNIKANIKVSSTETGIIYGSIVYDIAGTSQTEKTVTLNEIHIDIIDYISPGVVDDSAFRRMWAEFEWENKVQVNTALTNLREYLQTIMKATNMNCLTPESSLESADSSCGFLSANLYAKSAFDEDALANVSIELQDNGKITGFIRIRSKTQGIAISLGEKITQKQKG